MRFIKGRQNGCDGVGRDAMQLCQASSPLNLKDYAGHCELPALLRRLQAAASWTRRWSIAGIKLDGYGRLAFNGVSSKGIRLAKEGLRTMSKRAGQGDPCTQDCCVDVLLPVTFHRQPRLAVICEYSRQSIPRYLRKLTTVDGSPSLNTPYQDQTRNQVDYTTYLAR